MLIHCDRCGKGIRYTRDPADEQPGVCEACGEYLCASCAGEFDEYGRCENCQKEERITIVMVGV